MEFPRTRSRHDGLTPDRRAGCPQTRFAYEDRKENLQLPSVKNLIRQSNLAMWGFVLIAFGTLPQIVAVFG